MPKAGRSVCGCSWGNVPGWGRLKVHCIQMGFNECREEQGLSTLQLKSLSEGMNFYHINRKTTWFFSDNKRPAGKKKTKPYHYQVTLLYER